jgi:putative tryptophan/tyrosine transport system substrate-binding protein
MSHKIAFLALSAMLFALSFTAQAQQPAKVAKIGWLAARPLSGPTGGIELFRAEIRKLGYVEGKHFVFEYRSAENKIERLPALAEELVRLKVDVLIASSTAEATAAKDATSTIPILFTQVADPVSAGLIDSLARPGGNITGLTTIAGVLAGKRLELLKETLPKLTSVAILWNPQDTGSRQQWNESQLVGRELGLQIHSMEVSRAEQLESAFKGAAKVRSTALALTQSALFDPTKSEIPDLALKHRLPSIATRGEFVANGGLMSYGPDRAEPFRRAAAMVDKILKGTKPVDIPVERPTKFEFAVNLKTAKQIGVTIPTDILARGDKVIR